MEAHDQFAARDVGGLFMHEAMAHRMAVRLSRV